MIFSLGSHYGLVDPERKKNIGILTKIVFLFSENGPATFFVQMQDSM